MFVFRQLDRFKNFIEFCTEINWSTLYLISVSDVNIITEPTYHPVGLSDYVVQSTKIQLRFEIPNHDPKRNYNILHYNTVFDNLSQIDW